MKNIIKYMIILSTASVTLSASEDGSRLDFAQIMAQDRGDIYLGRIENFKELERRMAESSTDVVFSTKKNPDLEQALFVTRLKVSESLTEKYKVEFIDVAIPAVKVKGSWRPLCGNKSLRNESYFLIQPISLGPDNFLSVELSVPYSNEFGQSLKSHIAATKKAGLRR